MTLKRIAINWFKLLGILGGGTILAIAIFELCKLIGMLFGPPLVVLLVMVLISIGVTTLYTWMAE